MAGDTVGRIQDARRRLVETRIALRNSTDAFESAKAAAEQRAIDAAAAADPEKARKDPDKLLGGNEQARTRALVLALDKDSEYQAALRVLRALQATAERIEAELETLRDERRAEEWQIRARLAEALDRRGAQSDREDPGGDGAWDDAADQVILERAAEEAVRLAAEAEEAVQAATEIQPEDPGYWPDAFDRAIAEVDSDLSAARAARAVEQSDPEEIPF